MDETERRQKSHELHNESKKLLEKSRGSGCAIVIAIISLIIGFIFLPLSYKMVRNKIVGIDFTSLAFIMMCVFLGIGAILLVYGIITLIVASEKRVKVNDEIRQLQDETNLKELQNENI